MKFILISFELVFELEFEIEAKNSKLKRKNSKLKRKTQNWNKIIQKKNLTHIFLPSQFHFKSWLKNRKKEKFQLNFLPHSPHSPLKRKFQISRLSQANFRNQQSENCACICEMRAREKFLSFSLKMHFSAKKKSSQLVLREKISFYFRLSTWKGWKKFLSVKFFFIAVASRKKEILKEKCF